MIFVHKQHGSIQSGTCSAAKGVLHSPLTDALAPQNSPTPQTMRVAPYRCDTRTDNSSSSKPKPDQLPQYHGATAPTVVPSHCTSAPSPPGTAQSRPRVAHPTAPTPPRPPTGLPWSNVKEYLLNEPRASLTLSLVTRLDLERGDVPATVFVPTSDVSGLGGGGGGGVG